MSKPTPSPPPPTWPTALRIAHWTMALACLSAAGLAIGLIYAPAGEGDLVRRYLAWIDVHKLLGMLGLAALIWLALLHRRRPARTGDPVARFLAMAIQALLALLVVLLVASGYLASSLFGNPLAIPGLPVLPPLVAGDKAAGAVLTTVHSVSAYVFLALVGLHVAAALLHHFGQEDDTLMRMLGVPSTKRREPPESKADQ